MTLSRMQDREYQRDHQQHGARPHAEFEMNLIQESFLRAKPAAFISAAEAERKLRQ